MLDERIRPRRDTGYGAYVQYSRVRYSTVQYSTAQYRGDSPLALRRPSAHTFQLHQLLSTTDTALYRALISSDFSEVYIYFTDSSLRWLLRNNFHGHNIISYTGNTHIIKKNMIHKKIEITFYWKGKH